jgi:hypothetical protein
LRDLPDLEPLKAEGLLQCGQGDVELDGVLGVSDEADRDILEGNDALSR